MRVTFLSGDVHLGALGHLQSVPGQFLSRATDFRNMTQIVSSAIANSPHPDLARRGLTLAAKQLSNVEEVPLTRQGMRTWTLEGHAHHDDQLVAHRNWLSIHETDLNQLVARLRLEKKGKRGQFEIIRDVIPPLVSIEHGDSFSPFCLSS